MATAPMLGDLPVLTDRLVELRPRRVQSGDDDPSYDWTASWHVWRLEAGERIGIAFVGCDAERVFEVWIGLNDRRDYMGGPAAQAFRLLADFAQVRLEAERIVARADHIEQRAAIAEAGFRLEAAWPPQHAKRRRSIGQLRYVWPLRKKGS